MLGERLRSLGWHGTDFVGHIVSEELFRSGPISGSWARICTLARSEESLPLIVRSLKAELPVGVDRVDISLWSLSPSATVLTFHFLHSASALGSIEMILRREFKTLAGPTENGHRIWGAYAQKLAAIENRRASHHRSCAKFIADHVPGAFCEGVAPFENAFLDEFTTGVAEPFEGLPTEIGIHDYRRLLGIHQSWESFRDRENPSVWWLDIGRDSRGLRAASLWGNRDRIVSNEDLKRYGVADDHRAIFTLLASRVEAQVVSRACLSLLDGYLAGAAKSRDQMPTLGESTRAVLRRMSELERDLVRRQRDGATLARELVQEVEDRDELCFTGSAEWKGGGGPQEGRSLKAVWNSAILLRAKALTSSETQLRDQVNIAVSLATMRLQLRIQSQARFVSLMALIVAVAAVVISIATAE